MRNEIEELRASRERVVLAADADRRAFEHELHDGIQQRLIALAVNLQYATSPDTDPSGLQTLLEEMKREVEQALEDATLLAQRIHPPLPGTTGLIAALRSAAADASRVVHVDAKAATGSYPLEVLGTVYAVFVEVMGMGATDGRLNVTLREDGGALVFEVTDPGLSGSAADDAVDPRLRDRTEALGGRVAIEHGPGGGVVVKGSLPLSRWS